jgi:hypothetical protein
MKTESEHIPKSITLKAIPQGQGRDYFSIPVEDLQKRGINAEKLMMDLAHHRYVSKELLVKHGFDPNTKETVALNLPTNSGKTTLFYNLIERYG